MILKEIDFLSPKITLYQKGYLSHSSIISGIISIITLIIIISFGFCSLLDLIRRENPKVYFFNRFVEDAGIFPINSSSFFHYISLGSSQIIRDFDLYSFRMVGFETKYTNYLDNRNLSNFNHWLYGFCNIETDAQGVSYLLDKENFKKSICIRKYYNSLDKIYYDTEHPNFRWPTLSHGNSNPEVISYSVVMEKCEEDTLEIIIGKGNKCKNDLDKEYLLNGEFGTYFNFIDHYFDILDYKQPNRKYIFSVENTLDKDNYSINHINLNPSSIKTSNGILFDNTIEELSYIYDRNDVFTEYSQNNGVFMIFNLWMKNRKQYYKRIYKTIQDVISDIGGISEFITLIASYINSLYNNYNSLHNFQNLISPYIKKNNKNINSDNEFQNLNRIKFKKYESNKYENTDIERNNSNNKILNKQNNLNPNSNINKEKEAKDDLTIFKNKDIENINNEKIDNFINFLLHKLNCNKKNNYFKVYEKFRTNIISEEYLFKNYLEVYILLKKDNINECELENKFDLNDLINLGV